VLGNAATFLSGEDPKLAANLLEQTLSLEPDDPYWHTLLSSEYRQLAGRAGVAESPGLWTKAVSELEKAFLLQRGHRKRSLLNSIAETALEAGDTAKARDRANEAIAADAEASTSYYRCRSEFVLARIAVRSGDMPTARDFIRKACKDAAQDDKWGAPDMDLIEDLLSQGAKDDALEYLGLCEPMWPEKVGILRGWADRIRQGHAPAFSSWYATAPTEVAPSATTSQ
jgi:uncharacterized membrane-anchored protein